MKKAGLLIISIISSFVSFATTYDTISGVVYDADNSTLLAGASIEILGEGKGALTDHKGHFLIELPNHGSSLKTVVSFAGYENDTLVLSPTVPFYTLALKRIDSKLEDVVVHIGGRTLAKENPIAITKVSSQKIDLSMQSNMVDVLVKNVPGLNAVKTGPNISKPFIRGLGYNRVLTLYDGIRQEGQQWGDEHGIEIDPYGIAKAEVVKGPVSLIYGAGALAGVVSMTPFVPKDRSGKIHGRLTSEYQHNNGLIGNGIRLFNRSQDWYWLASGSYRMAKNYQNAIDGRVYNTNFRETTAALSLGHISAFGQSSLNVTLFNDLQGIPDGSRDSLTRKFTKQILEGDEDDITKRPLVSTHALNSYTISPLHQHIKHYRAYSNNHYQLGDGAIDLSIAWQQNSRQEFSHPTKPEQAGMYVRLNTLNYGLKYTLPIWQHAEITVGGNGMKQNNKNKNATDFPIPDYRLWEAGGFAFLKWKYNRLTVSGGIRYDHSNIAGDPLYTITDPKTGFDQKTEESNPTAKQLFSYFKKNFSGASFSLGSTIAINSNISLKANIARGYRPPSITELASNGLDPGAHIIYIGNIDSKPEFSFQQDLGIELDYPQLSGSISFFNNHISNYIYLTELSNEVDPISDAQGNKTFQYQQSSAHLYGLEFTAHVQPQSLKGFSWNNSLALTYGINTNPLYEGKGVHGRYLPYIPPATWHSKITQLVSLKSDIFTNLNFTTELEYNAAQHKYLGLYNTETATPSYNLINIAAGSTIQYTEKQSLKFMVAVNNLFNTIYQSNMSRLKYFEYYNLSPTNHYGIYAPGRNICIKIIFTI